MFNLATKYSFHLHKDSAKSLELYMLLMTLETYVNGAIIEMSRMERVRKSINKKMGTVRDSNYTWKKDFMLTYLHCDTHFFFICIDKCYKLINQLSVELGDKNIKQLYDKLKLIFDIDTIRNHLEHIDERCLGYLSPKDKRKNIKSHISDLGNFWANDFSFNNKRFPSGKKELKELKDIYKELVNILHNDYASKDPNFIQRINSERRIKLIERTLKKSGLYSI